MGVEVNPRPHASIGPGDREPFNQAIPDEMPLRRTLEWAARLPEDMLPSVLMCHYARVANVIAATWDDPASFRDYMKSLWADHPGHARRFSPDALQELAALERYFDRLNKTC